MSRPKSSFRSRSVGSPRPYPGIWLMFIFEDAVAKQLNEEMRRSAELDNVVLEMENTISQFRELVLNLQR